MKEIPAYRNCFVCGHENKIGLKARFVFDGKQATTRVTAHPQFEGYKGIYHGGIISTLMDEVMIKAILAVDRVAVTAEMTVKYHRPIKTGDELLFSGWVTKTRGRLMLTEGKVSDREGNLYASATGKYIEATDQLSAQLRTSLD